MNALFILDIVLSPGGTRQYTLPSSTWRNKEEKTLQPSAAQGRRDEEEESSEGKGN